MAANRSASVSRTLNPPEEPQLGADPTLMCRLYPKCEPQPVHGDHQNSPGKQQAPLDRALHRVWVSVGIYIVIRYKYLYRLPRRFLVGLAIEVGRWRMSLV